MAGNDGEVDVDDSVTLTDTWKGEESTLEILNPHLDHGFANEAGGNSHDQASQGEDPQHRCLQLHDRARKFSINSLLPPSPAVRQETLLTKTLFQNQLDTIINDTGVVPACNQIERHPRLPNPAMVEYCAKKNILITAYSAFGNNSFGLPLLVNVPEVKAVAERLSASTGKQVTGAQVVLAWSQIGGHSVIPKSVTPSRIRENFQEIELDDEAVKAIDAMAQDGRRFNIPATCEFFFPSIP